MITLRKLTDYLHKLLQPELFKDSCPNGLQVEGKHNIKKIGFAVSADLITIEKAIELGVDALVCHHGLFWQGDHFPLIGSKGKKISLLMRENISLYAYHLPLDAHKEVGNNWRTALDLQWENLAPFGEYKGSLIGVKGYFAPCSLQSLIVKLESYYGHSAIVAPGGKKEIASAALVSGGAWRSLQEAAEQGIDCFITGNFDEPAWGIAYEEKVHFIALGHSATEKVGPKALCDKVRQEVDIETLFIDNTNPF